MDDLDSLLPAEYNPRLIGEHDFKSLVDSVGKFGDMSGLVYNEQTGRIVGGHQRQKAYQEHKGKIEITEKLDKPNEVGTIARGYVLIGTEKFVYRVVDWPEEKERIANLAANRIQGEWDDDKLAELLYSLKDAAELPESGFSDKEVAEILATVSATEEDDADYSVPSEADTKTKLGDLYQLGDHRLLCGDATIASNYDVLLDGKLAEMVFTDPPYNVAYEGSAGQEASGKRRKKILNDKMADGEFEEFLDALCANLMKHTRGGFYICMSSSELHTLHNSFTAAGGHWQTYIIWAKNHFVMGRRDYQSQFEPVLYGLSEDDAKAADEGGERESLPIMYGWNNHAWYGGRKQGDVWLIDRPAASPDHPTVKPVELCAKAIRNSSKRGEIVLDVFCGSGSTLIAAQELERTCYAMELEPGYCDVIIRRWQDMTGLSAKLIKNIGSE